MKNGKLFRLVIKLDEVVEEELGLFTVFSNKQICSGIDKIKATLDVFNNQLNEFIEKVLIPNQKKK